MKHFTEFNSHHTMNESNVNTFKKNLFKLLSVYSLDKNLTEAISDNSKNYKWLVDCFGSNFKIAIRIESPALDWYDKQSVAADVVDELTDFGFDVKVGIEEEKYGDHVWIYLIK